MSSPAADHPGDRPDRVRTAGRGRDLLVAELGAEIRAVRAESRDGLERLGGMLAESADLLAVAVPTVRELRTEVAALTGRVDALADAATDPGSGTPVDWPSLDEASAAHEWGALAEWVASVLGPWYETRRGELPDCWALHRPAVIELVWLRRCYVAAHSGGAAPGASAEWHTRWRRDALANIAAAIPPSLCRPGEHLVPSSQSSGAVRSPVPPAFAAQPPPSVAATAARVLTAPTGAGAVGPHRTGAEREVTTSAYWERHYRAAAAADLEWRRERAAAVARSAAQP